LKLLKSVITRKRRITNEGGKKGIMKGKGKGKNKRRGSMELPG